jgi:hypothetical protein
VPRLPREWGFTTLEVFADALVAGYRRCVELLAEPRAAAQLTQQFDIARVHADVAFGIRQGGTPAITVTHDTAGSDELIFGRMGIELERLRSRLGVTLTLVAPGYVLTGNARDAFVRRAQRVADQIAREFDDTSVDYGLAIRQPHNAKEIVVMLTTEQPDDPFTYLVTWPVRSPHGERHFVFRCVEDDDSLGEIEALVRASDRVADVSVASAAASSFVDEDVYKAYNQFFRAARVWRSGVSHEVQSARLFQR